MVKKSLLSMKMMSPGTADSSPPKNSKDDMMMSFAHHMDSVNYNLAHAGHHLMKATAHMNRMGMSVKKHPLLKSLLRQLNRKPL